jgi:hypothetical protein
MTRNRCAIVVGALALTCAATADAVLTVSQKCEAAKNKAIGKIATCLANERAKEVKGNVPDYVKCYDKCSAAFIKAEQKAVDAGGSCPTTEDSGFIEENIDLIFGAGSSIGIPQAVSATRFIDNGDGTVTDTRTALTWEKKTGTLGAQVDCSGTTCTDPHDVNNSYQWCKDADHSAACDTAGNPADGGVFTDFLAKLNNCTSSNGATLSGGFAGHCDWRLPTLQELQSILDFSAPGCGSGSACITPIFGPTKGSFAYYWALTLDGNTPVNAWYVFFDNGFAGGLQKYTSQYVRAVRGQ